MDAETFMMAPTVIAEKARQLYRNGLYEQALKLLQRNMVIYEIYPHKVEVKTHADVAEEKRK